MADAKRESRKQFLARVEKEGRHQEAETFYDGLIASGVSARESRRRAVETFQPIDGSRTAAWETPNRWEEKPKGAAGGRNGTGKSRVVSHRRVLEWVWEHMSDEHPPKAPNGRAQALLDFARKQPGDFLDKYAPLLVRGSKDLEEPDSEKAVLGDSLKTLREWANRVGYGDPPNDWKKNYQDARSCPLKDDCPEMKAAREQAKRAYIEGRVVDASPSGGKDCEDL